MVVFTSGGDGLHRAVGCKRLAKWWYLQGIKQQLDSTTAVKGLQNGGIYKDRRLSKKQEGAVKGLQLVVFTNTRITDE